MGALLHAAATTFAWRPGHEIEFAARRWRGTRRYHAVPLQVSQLLQILLVLVRLHMRTESAETSIGLRLTVVLTVANAAHNRTRQQELRMVPVIHFMRVLVNVPEGNELVNLSCCLTFAFVLFLTLCFAFAYYGCFVLCFV